jgi:hypothetical protein
LIESITQTKASLIASGNPKGFSGMKICDIITKISEYIETNVISINSIVSYFNQVFYILTQIVECLA